MPSFRIGSNKLKALLQNESGQAVVEYALLLTLIAAVSVMFLILTGSSVQTLLARLSIRLWDTDDLELLRKKQHSL